MKKVVITLNGYEKRKEEKKKRILKAALELMNSKGRESSVTMEEIAKRANVAKNRLLQIFWQQQTTVICEVYKEFFRGNE